jgi:hypothetical protein
MPITYLLIATLFTLSSCATSYTTISPDLMRDTDASTVYEKALQINGSEYVLEDTSGRKPVVFKISPIKDEKKTAGWWLEFSPKLGLTFDRDHFCQVDISNDADSLTRTLIYVFCETSDGVSTDSALGDTVLILEDGTRAGYFLRTGADNVSGFTFPRSVNYRIELGGVVTDVDHRLEGVGYGDDSYFFHRGDSLLAMIGNGGSPPIGTFKYHAYIRKGLAGKGRLDLFFCYLAVEAFGSFQGYAAHVQSRH